MNKFIGIETLLLLTVVLAHTGTSQAVRPAMAEGSFQTDRFHYRPEAVPVGTVFFYKKSNIDGSNASRVALHVSALDHLEAFKWHPGEGAATLVIAKMDWETFTVRSFESLRLFADGTKRIQARLGKVADQPVVAVQAGSYREDVTIQNWPWHSYDFDFASLGVTLPHLKDAETTFQVGISDVVRSPDGMAFADKGPVTLRYLGKEEIEGTECRKYNIDGPGLEDRGGHLWTDAATGLLVRYEIDLPDEPGFESGRLSLISQQKMTNDEWLQFKEARLKGE